MLRFPGPTKVTLQVKLTKAFQAKTSLDSGFPDMLQKVVFRKQDGCGGGVACFSGCLQVSAGEGVTELSREWGTILDLIFHSCFCCPDLPPPPPLTRDQCHPSS